MSQPSSICSSVSVSAGSRRMTVSCVQLMSKPLLQARLHDRRAVDRQFDADHRALDADLRDERALRLERREARAEPLADLHGALEQVVGFDGLDGRQGGAGGERVAAERRRVRAGLELLGDLRLRDQPAHRDAAGQRLGQRHDVRLDVPVLVGVPLAGAAHAGLHLVEDQQQAVLVAQLAQALRGSRPAAG